MSPMNWADGGMSKHNTESTQTSCLAEHCPCCHSSAAVKQRRSTPFTLHRSAYECIPGRIPPFCSEQCGPAAARRDTRRLREAVLVIAPSNRQRRSGTLRRRWPRRANESTSENHPSLLRTNYFGTHDSIPGHLQRCAVIRERPSARLTAASVERALAASATAHQATPTTTFPVNGAGAGADAGLGLRACHAGDNRRNMLTNGRASPRLLGGSLNGQNREHVSPSMARMDPGWGTRKRDKTSKVQDARITGIEGMAGPQASAQQNQIGGRQQACHGTRRDERSRPLLEKPSIQCHRCIREQRCRPDPNGHLGLPVVISGGGGAVNHSGGTATAGIILSGSGRHGRAAQGLDEVTLQSVMSCGNTETRQRMRVAGHPGRRLQQRAPDCPGRRAENAPSPPFDKSVLIGHRRSFQK
ncbi:hypothetical protein SVAN01_04453 [Stagonosporopsis vannaccii]|nr:hypothetical protein SVAN01_04453 [Stagonosporopsis vannaccii]